MKMNAHLKSSWFCFVFLLLNIDFQQKWPFPSSHLEKHTDQGYLNLTLLLLCGIIYFWIWNEGYTIKSFSCFLLEWDEVLSNLFCSVGFIEHYVYTDHLVVKKIYMPLKKARYVPQPLGEAEQGGGWGKSVPWLSWQWHFKMAIAKCVGKTWLILRKMSVFWQVGRSLWGSLSTEVLAYILHISEDYQRQKNQES